jgi:hypothetical protein
MPAFWSHLKKVADPVLQRTAGMSVLPAKMCTSTKTHHVYSYVNRQTLISKLSQHFFELGDECNELPMLQMQKLH